MKILFSTILSLLMSLQVFAEDDVVEYRDATGTVQKKAASDVTVLDENTDVEHLASGWYVAMGDLTYTTTFMCETGDLHLILADGANLKIIDTWMEHNFTIYGQTKGNGSLTIENLNASDNLTINGGNITASENIGGDILTINGGNIAATGSIYAWKSIILGYMKSTDRISAKIYDLKKGTVIFTIKDGQAFKVEDDEHLYAGTLSGDEISNIAGKTLIPVEGVWYKVTTPDFITATPSVAKEGDEITFTIGNAPEGVDWQYYANDVKIEFGDDKTCTYTMSSENVTVMAYCKVPYIDDNGDPKEQEKCQVLMASTNVENLAAGWYVAMGDLTYQTKVNCNSGDLHLILADGASLTIENSGILYANDNITIYGQTDGTGKLDVETGDFCIESHYGNITINGGDITLLGSSYGIYTSNGDLIINGGQITAEGNSYGFSCDGNITINGGNTIVTGTNFGIYVGEGITINGGDITAEATGNNSTGIYANGGIIINGGNVTATATGEYRYGINSPSSDVVLGYTNSTNDRITASKINGEKVYVKDGQIFKVVDGDKETFYYGTLTSEKIAAIADQTLIPVEGYPISTPAFITASKSVAQEGEKITLSIDPQNRTSFMFSCNGTEFGFNEDGKYTFDMPAKQVDITCSVLYLDEDGDEHSRDDYTILTEDTDVDDLDDGWYVAVGNLKYEGQVRSNGKFYLILADGASLTCSKVAVESELFIYGQKKGTGKLVVNNSDGSAIYAEQHITINGGDISATGEKGIYCEGGISINGGIINATTKDEENGYGIYSSDGSITLGYNKITDRITASSFEGSDGVSVKDDQEFKDENSVWNRYSGTLTAEQIAAIKGKTLVPNVYSISTPDFIIATPSFAKTGATITFTIGNVPEGIVLQQCFANGSEIQFDENNECQYTMPDENVTVTATATVSYIDGEGNPKQQEDCQVLTASTDVEKLEGVWYVAMGELEYSGKIYFGGDGHLILADGASLTCSNVEAYDALAIYGQTNGTGKLVASNNDDPALYAYFDITINGGNISATGTSGIESYAYSVIINGGIINATATDEDGYGIYSGDENICLGYTNSTNDHITASKISGKKVYVKGGQIFKVVDGDNETFYYGTLTPKQIAAIAGKTLIPVEGVYSVSTPDFITASKSVAQEGEKITLSIDPQIRTSFKFKFNGEEFTFNDDGQYPFYMPAKQVDITCSVLYLDKDGNEQYCDEYTILTQDTKVDDLDEGWYVAVGELEYTDAFGATSSGCNINLILVDGASLVCKGGISGIEDLYIYVQKAGTGSLTASNKDDDAINVWTMYVYGGNITVNGMNNGIYCDISIHIYGSVMATGGESGYGLYSSENAVELGYSKPTDKITVSKYKKVYIKEGQVFKDENGRLYFGKLSEAEIAAISNKTITPATEIKDLLVINGDVYYDQFDIDEHVGVTANVGFKRTFKKGITSTVMLPFKFDASKFNGTFRKLDKVEPKDGVWTATTSTKITETTLEANTPYIFEPAEDIDHVLFENVTLEKPDFNENNEVVVATGVSDWSFVGVYEYKKWEKQTPTEYGFAATAKTYNEGEDNEYKVAAGEFVRAGEGTWIKATRCFLRYSGTVPELLSKSAVELPERIVVVFPDEDGDDDGDIETPVSEIVPSSSAASAKVWSYDKTIYIEAQVGMAYQVIDLNGRPLLTSVTTTDREVITLPRANSGVVIVRIGNKSYKIMY